ncbi:MAG: tetratricopeptide repeat protein [Pseudomonadota bacterium]
MMSPSTAPGAVLVEPAARFGAGLPAPLASLLRITLGVAGGLAAIALAAMFVDPMGPRGCPDALATGQDCASYGAAGRLWAGYRLTRANAAETPQAALPDVEMALALRPNMVFAFNTKGIALAALNRPDEAMAAYARALQLAPGYLAARANRAALYQRLGLTADAAREFQTVYDSPPDSHRREAVIRYARAVDRSTP